MQNTNTREQIIATIDELNQYLNGNVTTDSLRDTLEECQLALDGIFINK